MNITTREQWGAAPVPAGRTRTVSMDERVAVFLHYLGEEESREDVHAQLRGVQAFHQGPEREWADVGYNYAIAQTGEVLEARGRDVVGAHCPGHNRSGIGVVFLLGGDEVPSDAAKVSAVRLIDKLEADAGRPLAVKGHRDGKSTACPGEAVYAWIEAGLPLDGAEGPAPAPASKAKLPKLARILRQNSRGTDVTELQRALIAARYTSLGRADGYFGPKTRRALMNFQRNRGLVVDGVYGPKTHKALRGA